MQPGHPTTYCQRRRHGSWKHEFAQNDPGAWLGVYTMAVGAPGPSSLTVASRPLSSDGLQAAWFGHAVPDSALVEEVSRVGRVVAKLRRRFLAKMRTRFGLGLACRVQIRRCSVSLVMTSPTFSESTRTSSYSMR